MDFSRRDILRIATTTALGLPLLTIPGDIVERPVHQPLSAENQAQILDQFFNYSPEFHSKEDILEHIHRIQDEDYMVNMARMITQVLPVEIDQFEKIHSRLLKIGAKTTIGLLETHVANIDSDTVNIMGDQISTNDTRNPSVLFNSDSTLTIAASGPLNQFSPSNWKVTGSGAMATQLDYVRTGLKSYVPESFELDEEGNIKFCTNGVSFGAVMSSHPYIGDGTTPLIDTIVEQAPTVVVTSIGTLLPLWPEKIRPGDTNQLIKNLCVEAQFVTQYIKRLITANVLPVFITPPMPLLDRHKANSFIYNNQETKQFFIGEEYEVYRWRIAMSIFRNFIFLSTKVPLINTLYGLDVMSKKDINKTFSGDPTHYQDIANQGNYKNRGSWDLSKLETSPLGNPSVHAGLMISSTLAKLGFMFTERRKQFNKG